MSKLALNTVQSEQTELVEYYCRQGRTFFDEGDYIQSIEYLSSALAICEHSTARQYLARCYFRLNRYEAAYRNYQLLLHDNSQKNYAHSMLAVIEGIWGQYDNSINTLNQLPWNVHTQINLAHVYLLKYQTTHDHRALKHVYTILSSIELDSVIESYHWEIYLPLAMYYCYIKHFSKASLYFTKALSSTTDQIAKSIILNEQALFYIEMNKLEQAELLLNQSLEFIHTTNTINIQCNNKYRRLLEEKKAVKQQEKQQLIAQQFHTGIELFEKAEYLKAIEVFSIILGECDHHLARLHLARCYFRLNEFSESYKHFSFLIYCEEHRDYAISMLVTISALQGNHSEAIKMIKKLPATITNKLNLAVFYLLKYLEEGGEWLLREAKRILLAFDYSVIPTRIHWKIHFTLAQVYQAQNEYHLACSQYNQAQKAASSDIDKGAILNELGMFYIEMNELDQAELVLEEALLLLKDKNSLEEGYNAKYRGLIAKKRRDYQKAKNFFTLAADKFHDKNLYKNLAEVTHMLVELHNPPFEFYQIADLYAEAIYYEKKREEVWTSHAKVLDFAFNNFVGSDNYSSSYPY